MQLRSKSFYSSLTLVLLLGCVVDLAAQSELRIGIVGDQTYSSDLRASYQVLARGIEILSKENVAAVLHTGDLVESRVAPEEYRRQFAEATRLLDRLRKPWHLAPGDHDVNPPEYVQNSTDRSREELYRELYRQREPRLTDTLNHSFDLMGYHFIALNSQEHLHGDPRWGDVFLNRFTAPQYEWLENDLANHQNAKGVIVFIHHPMWYNWSGWAPVHQLLHHYDQDDGELDGIRYVVVGSTGGTVKNASRDAGNVHHVTVMTLSGRNVAFRLIAVDGSGPLQLTPRADMDRVQAIDTSMGEVSCFVKDFPCPLDKQNFVCLQSNQLRGIAGQPARLSLVRIGNAIDLPVTVNVSLVSDKLSLVNPHYVTGVCGLADGSCVLAPAVRVQSSNTSSTVLSDPLSPLWESGLAIRNPVAIGDKFELKVRLSFQSAAGELFVEKRVVTKISTCSDTAR